MRVSTYVFVYLFIPGVYFEKMLKNVSSSMWIQNIRLSLMTLVFAALTMWTTDGAKILEGRALAKFAWSVPLFLS